MNKFHLPTGRGTFLASALAGALANALVVALAVSAGTAVAADAANASDSEFILTIENHAFSPKELKIPANKKVKLKVVNKDATPAEFESKPLAREKAIPGKSTAIVLLGPLKPGRYAFVEEYHETEAGAQGTIVVE